MKKAFLIVVLLSSFLWSFDFDGQFLIDEQVLAQPFDFEGVVTNPAFFINSTETFQTASFEFQRPQIQASPVFLGQSALHIDTTSRYRITARTQFDGSRTLLPKDASRTAQQEPRLGQCDVSIDGGSFADGSTAPASEIYDSTSGTSGRDHNIQLQVNATSLEQIALGNYACEVQIDVVRDDVSVFFIRGLIEFIVVNSARD